MYEVAWRNVRVMHATYFPETHRLTVTESSRDWPTYRQIRVMTSRVQHRLHLCDTVRRMGLKVVYGHGWRKIGFGRAYYAQLKEA